MRAPRILRAALALALAFACDGLSRVALALARREAASSTLDGVTRARRSAILRPLAALERAGMAGAGPAATEGEA